jgi:CHAT domain-containing protein
LNVPLESGLFLAKKKCLTLKQLLNVRTKGLRLAVLSACETGVIGSSLPDEVVNLPTGLLLARTAGVIASLWAVTDLSSSLLMARFYNAWQFDGIAVIEALRKAQIWLRDTDNAEKIAYLRRLPMKGECWNATECLVKELSSLAPTATSFSHPYHWAAFVLVGL